MTRFLIEVAHENKKEACDRAVRMFMETGSHFMTNADWGCSDNVHKTWFIMEAETKEEAQSILPPLFRHDAKIIALQKFRIEDFYETRKQHED